MRPVFFFEMSDRRLAELNAEYTAAGNHAMLSRVQAEQLKRRLAQPYTLSMFDRIEKPAAPVQVDMFAGMSV